MIRDKLNNVGDAESAAVLDIILADEIGHVAIGNRWFKHLCAQQGRDPWPATRNWRNCTARLACAVRSIWKRAAPPVSTKPNWRLCRPLLQPCNHEIQQDETRPSRHPIPSRFARSRALLLAAALAASLPAMPAVAADSFDGCLARLRAPALKPACRPPPSIPTRRRWRPT